MGFKKLVKLSTRSIDLNSSFLTVLTSFWNPSVNQFQFSEGYMTITIYDGLAISGASPAGFALPLRASEHHHASMKNYLLSRERKLPSSSGALIPSTISAVAEGEKIPQDELISFYLYLLCKFVSATKSKRPTMGMLLWAVALAEWTEEDAIVEFGPIILACAYDGLSSSVHEKSTISIVPYWLVQLWGEYYFPNIHAIINGRKERDSSAKISIEE